MTNGPTPQQPQPPGEIYGIFAGNLDSLAVQKFSSAFAIGVNNGIKRADLIFQSPGGIIGDGVALYNIFKACPLDLTLYNVGTIASIGVIAFLGAKNRKASANATFMIHRTQAVSQSATSDRLHALARSVTIDDDRVEAILHKHINLPKEKWEIHKHSDVWLSAAEAKDAGIIDAIEDFAPPKGAPFVYIGPQV